MNLTTLMVMAVVSQPTLELPWDCGDTYMCTQGHNGGSHTGYGAWAWDFGLDEGDDVLASVDGVVEAIKMDSNVGGCDSAYANDGNYVVVDHGDGTAALYLHMAQWSSSLSVGDFVCTGDVLGRIGLTGWTCGAHLHFQVQDLCGSWWCDSMQAEFYGYGDPGYGDWLTSDNCGGGCDCEAVLDGGETTVSESDSSCFLRESQWWWDSNDGYGGHHYYTYATDESYEETVGEWLFTVTVGGQYEVLAYIPNSDADSHYATYRIHHADGISEATINQSSDKGWQSLGRYRFDTSGDQYVHLGDNTGEDYSTLMRKIAYDAIRFDYWTGDDDDASDDDDDDAGDDDDATSDDDATGDDDAAGDDDATPPRPPGRDETNNIGACSCEQIPSPAHTWIWGLAGLAGALWLRRRC